MDAWGINSIYITAADYIRSIEKSMADRGIKFYITGHTAGLNDQFRKLGLGNLIEKGMVRRTITTGLNEMGYNEPFPLEGVEDSLLLKSELTKAEEHDSLQEFVWAFGADARYQMVSTFDEDELLGRLEMHLAEIAENFISVRLISLKILKSEGRNWLKS